MAFTRKRFFKRRRTYRTKKARKARKVARMGTVKRMINSRVEHKWLYFAIGGQVDYNTTAPALLNGISKGDNRNNRIGNQIRCLSLQFTSLVAAQGIVSRVRVIVFRDKQAIAGTPTGGAQVANLFAQGSPASTTTVLSPLNPDLWPSRFVLIFDRVFNADIEGGAVDFNTERQHRYFKKLNFVTQYNDGNTGGAADINKNALYVLAISDEVNTTATRPAQTFAGVLRYVDA